MNAIEIQGLTKRYGPITAVDGLDLTVRQGSCSPCWGSTAPERPPPSKCCPA